MSAEAGRPVTPQETKDFKRQNYPNSVFKAFNQLLSERKVGNEKIIISQPEVVDLMVKFGLDKHEIHRSGWLNIDDLYEEAGWEVKRNKPSADDEGFVFYTFTPATKS